MIDRQRLDVRGGDGPPGFGVRTRVDQGDKIVEVMGELDIDTAGLLDEVLSRNGAGATGRAVVDVSDLRFMGAAGLHVLVEAHYRLVGQNQQGLVVRGASGIVRRMVELTELSFLLEGTDSARAVACQGLRGRDLETGRRAAGLSVTGLFVAYFALGGTADLGQVRAFLGGCDAALDGHQQAVAAHAVNERLVALGHRDRLLSYTSG